MKTYTKKEIAYIIQCSVRTVEDDIKYLGIKPIDREDYGQNIYSESDYQLITKLRSHCREPGKTRETFILSTPTEIVRNEPTKLSVIQPKEETIIRDFMLASMRADPLADLELLQRIANNNWLLPTKKLAAIIGIKTNTLLKNSCYNHCGFTLTKKMPANGTYLWAVKQLVGENSA